MVEGGGGCEFCLLRQDAPRSNLPPPSAAVADRLREAVRSGRPTLDLYNTHFWNWQERTDGFGPCQESVDFWKLDKPIVYAELPAHVHSHVDRYATELLDCTLRHGFHGALFWAYNDPGSKLLDALQVLTKASAALPTSIASYEALVSWLAEPQSPPPTLRPPPSPCPPRPPPLRP